MVEVYGKKARQINVQDPAHRRAYTWVNAQCKEFYSTISNAHGERERKCHRAEFEGTENYEYEQL